MVTTLYLVGTTFYLVGTTSYLVVTRQKMTGKQFYVPSWALYISVLKNSFNATWWYNNALVNTTAVYVYVMVLHFFPCKFDQTVLVIIRWVLCNNLLKELFLCCFFILVEFYSERAQFPAVSWQDYNRNCLFALFCAN